VHSSSHTVAPALYSKLPYDAAADFSPVIVLGNLPTVLFVSSAKGYKSIAEFVAAAKAKSGSINYGSGGVGNATHLNAERFMLSAGFRAVHVPFKGSPEALTEVLAERIDFSFSTLLPALSLLQDGRLKALAVSSLQRASALPDVPTTTEAGFPNSDYNFWVGMLVPKATSRAIVDILHRESEKALQMPEVQAKMRALGADPMPMTSDQFEKLIADEITMNKELVKRAGIAIN
jgi:tripartite-type tricarboxylate transporter receptor subunit TctC